MPDDARRAAVLTPFFEDRDAVCNDVHHSAVALRKRGWEARVFALAGKSEREEIFPITQLEAFLRSRDDVLYFHFSTGHSEINEAIAALECRKVLKFHNVTPPEFFSMWSDELSEASRIGRADIPRIAGLRWDSVLAASAFNLAELQPFVAASTPSLVLPPFHDTDEMLELAPPGMRRADPPHVLTVGRIAPSKGHPFLLRTLRYLVHDLGTPVVLDIVGKPDSRLLGYWRMLELMVREFRLDAFVTFHRELSSQQLAACYAGASAFLCTSEHEGFCVPIVEAMAFGVPVIALATAAVPETVGDAGILWEERDPRRFALTIARLLESSEEARWLADCGRRRFEECFSNASIERRMSAALGIEPVVAALP